MDQPDTIPLITISNIPDLISQKLYGHYFGWTRYKPNPKSEVVLDDDWHNSIISALPPTASQLQRADFSKANSKVFTVKFIDELETSLPMNENLEIYIMGFLAPDDPIQRSKLNSGLPLLALDDENSGASQEEMEEINRLCVVQAILANPAWSPEAARDCGRADKVEGLKKVITGISGAKGVVQGQMGRVPVHKLGVRMEGDGERDKTVVINGFVVRR